MDHEPPISRLPSAHHGQVKPVRARAGKEGLLGLTRGLDQLGPLGGAELAAGGPQPFLGAPPQRGVHIVPAQHQVLAHGDAAERRPLGGDGHLDQGEIRGAAAHVHHENQAHAGEGGRQVVPVPRGEVVKRGLRLLHQGELPQPGLLGGAHGEGAGDLVEGRGHGDDHLLGGQRRVRVRLVPGPDDMGEEPRGGLDGRDSRDFGEGAPREDRRGAVHAGMTQPALGGGHQPPRHPGALPAGEFSNQRGGCVLPGQPRGFGR